MIHLIKRLFKFYIFFKMLFITLLEKKKKLIYIQSALNRFRCKENLTIILVWKKGNVD